MQNHSRLAYRPTPTEDEGTTTMSVPQTPVPSCRRIAPRISAGRSAVQRVAQMAWPIWAQISLRRPSLPVSSPSTAGIDGRRRSRATVVVRVDVGAAATISHRAVRSRCRAEMKAKGTPPPPRCQDFVRRCCQRRWEGARKAHARIPWCGPARPHEGREDVQVEENMI
jgi:hypothetical protein